MKLNVWKCALYSLSKLNERLNVCAILTDRKIRRNDFTALIQDLKNIMRIILWKRQYWIDDMHLNVTLSDLADEALKLIM